jgi:hypothetical protein
MLLAGPYRAREIMDAMLSYVAVLATMYWAGMTVMAALALGLVTWTSGDTLSLTTGYAAAALILPLLSAWAASGLGLLVALLFPRLTQAGSLGLNIGGGGIGNLPAIAPGLAVLFAFISAAPHVSPGVLLAIAGTLVAAVAASASAIVSRRFQPEAVLDS